jgi:hypothetical protein
MDWSPSSEENSRLALLYLVLRLNTLYGKPEYKATPYFSNEKIRRKKVIFVLTTWNMSFSSEGCKQIKVNAVKIKYIQNLIPYI